MMYVHPQGRLPYPVFPCYGAEIKRPSLSLPDCKPWCQNSSPYATCGRSDFLTSHRPKSPSHTPGLPSSEAGVLVKVAG